MYYCFTIILCFLLLYQYGVESKLPSMFGSDDFKEKINQIDIIDKNKVSNMFGSDDLIEKIDNNEIMSFYYDDYEKCYKKKDKQPEIVKFKNKSSAKFDNICDIYFMRFLNRLITMANLKEDYDYPENSVVSLNLLVKSKSLRIIRSFARGKNNIYTWYELDAAFADLLGIKNEEFIIPAHKPTYSNNYSQPSNSPEFKITTVICCLIFMAFWLILKGVSIKSTLLLIFLSAFGIGLASTWLYEIEAKRIEAIVTMSRNENIPDDCIYHKLSWWRWILPIRKNECKEYHWAHVDPMSQVIFTEVLSKTFTNMVAVPLPILGDALGKMTSSFTQNLPWSASALMNSITIPFVFPIMAFITILIIILVICGPGLIFSAPFASITTKDPPKPEQPQNIEHKKESPRSTKIYINIPSRQENVSRKYVPVHKSQSEVFIKTKEDKRPKLMRHKSDIIPNNVKQKSTTQDLVEFIKPKPKRQKIVNISSESEESFYEEIIIPSKRESPIEESGYSVISHDELNEHSESVSNSDTDSDDIDSID